MPVVKLLAKREEPGSPVSPPAPLVAVAAKREAPATPPAAAVAAGGGAREEARCRLVWQDGRLLEEGCEGEGLLVVALLCRGIAHGAAVARLLAGAEITNQETGKAAVEQVWAVREPGVLWLVCLGAAPPSPSSPMGTRDDRLARFAAAVAAAVVVAGRDALECGGARHAIDEGVREWLGERLRGASGTGATGGITARLRAMG